jgi:ketosteroid isomerase-like protein
MRLRILSAILILSCASAATFFTPPLNSAVTSSPEPSPGWLAGHWCADNYGKTVEELWLPPHGGVMVGLGRTRSPERTTGFEYFRIADLDSIQSFIAQPGGQPPVSFGRTAGGENWIRFENPDHDFPQRIEYRREGQVLHAEVSGPGENGNDAVIGFDYRPCGPQTSPSEDTNAIRLTRESSNQAIAGHDVDGILSFLEEEYVITISSGAIMYGREKQAESWAGHFAEFPDVVYVRTPLEVTISDSQPLAIENGSWIGTMTTPNGALEKGGQYTAAWRKVDGAWKIYSELFVVLYENIP